MPCPPYSRRVITRRSLAQLCAAYTNRMSEFEILPACSHYGIGVVPYSPLARGVLTGKNPPGQLCSEGTRAGSGDKRILETEFREESLVIAQKIRTRCEARSVIAMYLIAAYAHDKTVSALFCLRRSGYPARS